MFRSRKLSYSYPSTTGQFNADYADLPLKKLLVNIPVTQTGSGTPSPDNIRDFIGVSGVNIGNDNKYADFITWNQIVEDEGISGQSDNTDTASSLRFQVMAGESPYTSYYWRPISTPTTIRTLIKPTVGSNSLFFQHNGSTRNLHLYDSTYGMIANHVYYLNIDFTAIDITTVGGIVWKDLQLNDLTVVFGDTKANEIYAMEQAQTGSGVAYFKELFPNNYYSYNSGTLSTVSAVNGSTNSFYPISFGQTVYSANLNVLTGVLSITHIRKAMSDLTWAIVTDATSGFGYDYFRSSGNIEDMNTSDFSVVSDCLVNNKHTRGELLNNEIGQYNSANYSRRLVCRADSITTIEDWNTFIADKYIVYELSTPIEIPLGGIDIKTLQGVNNIFTDIGTVETQCIKLGN